MVTASVGDGTGRMQVVFFNQPWRERQLTEGLQVALFGKAEEYRGGLQMTNPIVDLIGDRTGRIVAIYPQSEKVQLTTWELAGWIENALERCQPRGVADPVPDGIRRRLGLIGRGDALRSIHLPETMREKESARRRLAFDELLRVQLVLVMRKRALEHEARGLEPRHRRRARCGASTMPFRTRSPAPSCGRSPRSAPIWRRPIRCTGCCRATSDPARPWLPCRRC